MFWKLQTTIDIKNTINYFDTMAVINILNLPDEIRNEYKAICAKKGISMREDLVRYITKTVEKAKK